LTSDRGPQFASEVWSILMSKLQIRHHLTTAYHPQSNGMVERAHRQLKEALRSRLAGSSWTAHLPWVLLGLRAAPKDDAAISSAELVYGSPLRLPGQPQLGGPSPPPPLEAAPVFSGPTSIETRQRSYADVASALPAALLSSSFVYIRRGATASPLAPAYSGPYRVLSRSAKFFRVAVGDREEDISVDRLKPHTGLSPVSPAAPPRRGRPSSSAPAIPGSALGAGRL